MLSRADLVPDLSSEAAPPSLIPDQCAIRIALPAPPPAELGQFSWERRADGAGVDVCLLPMAAPAGALDCELLGLEAELGALRGLVEAAAALAAREARSGEGEEALRRVSGLLGAAAAARGAKGVEVKAILAADDADADPAERARADLEHLEAREREIASWGPR